MISEGIATLATQARNDRFSGAGVGFLRAGVMNRAHVTWASLLGALRSGLIPL